MPVQPRPESWVWVGALSFEERCVASLERLVTAGIAPSSVLLLEYPTAVHPASQDRDRRGQNRKRISSICARAPRAVELRSSHVEPYSYRAVQRVLLEHFESVRCDFVALDLSCLTKIHAIALADPRLFARAHDWELAYTVPETYGHLVTSKGSDSGWRDVLVLPVGESTEMTNETQARGVVLAGHEGDRLIIALTELEPTAGIVVTARAEGRPDLRRESVRRNEKMTRLLEARGTDRWSREVISVRDPDTFATAIDGELAQARRAKAPVLLYPFGPKPFVSLAAMQLAGTDDVGAWCVYPIPNSYDVDYSYGIGETVWYQKAVETGSASQPTLTLGV